RIDFRIPVLMGSSGTKVDQDGAEDGAAWSVTLVMFPGSA
ncbi:MAG: hypothetical protein ACI9U1_002013, partial [Porticoccaceae bacterium]